ncbi:hypothetical protein HY988_02365 [Candidatus Micrarchaeota archaeon]|nr:hypothetical protein [Candidatus Micrarchaeota archaeon]
MKILLAVFLVCGLLIAGCASPAKTDQNNSPNTNSGQNISVTAPLNEPAQNATTNSNTSAINSSQKQPDLAISPNDDLIKDEFNSIYSDMDAVK